jgi:hypothetical protein
VTARVERVTHFEALQWHVDGAVDPFFRFARFGDQFQIGNTLADSDVELMSIDDSGKEYSTLLAPLCFAQQVIILRKKYAPKFGGTIEEFRVIEFCGLVILSCEDIYFA